ncbi:MAG TPA: type III PLP-dependent enzyme, partial [Alphaproteobacteria bacterium]|nr:type III PLP-dependent enzyme [Alphaproteobacteria bacterium]
MDYNELMPLAQTNASATETNLLIETPEIRLPRYASVEDAVKSLRPAQPLRCMHPEKLRATVSEFVTKFPGQTFYAVKVNSDPYVLQTVWAGGCRNFDVASLNEIKLTRGMFPTARLAFMHPIKSREAIRAAYAEYGVRDFAVDTFEELHKILEETQLSKGIVAADLAIHVRLAMPKGSASHDLSGKFGAAPEAAAKLLKDAAQVAAKVGLCFHVGSQCMDPVSYTEALDRAGEVIKASGVQLDVLDVGGGFPVSYPDCVPPSQEAYFTAISAGVKKLKLPKSCQVWAEPGRALATPAETLIVRVELRKGNALYINDGGYGSLLDGMMLGQRWPVQQIRPRRRVEKKLIPFTFYGPTCDSLDKMAGPFMLPEDMREGDWIAIGMQGAYCASM